MNELKIGGGSINDLINDGVDFFKNNKGLFAQVGLGAAELYAAMTYAKESEDIILKGISCFPIICGTFNIWMGCMIRPSHKVTYNGSVLSNEKFICVEQIIAKGIKDDILGYKK